MIESNIIHVAYFSGVKKLLFLGSFCIYPKQASQPIKEKYLLSGESDDMIWDCMGKSSLFQ